MANKRMLKKAIRNACGSVVYACYCSGLELDDCADVLCQAAILQEVSVARVNAAFNGKAKDYADAKAYRAARNAYFKQYYAEQKKAFEESLEKLVKQINGLKKAEV